MVFDAPDVPGGARRNDEMDVLNAFEPGSFHELLGALDVQKQLNSDPGAVAKREKFIEDCAHLRSRMRQSRRFLINPRSKEVQYWDFATSMALLFTATVTPYEVGLGLETKIDGLFFVNFVVNLIFTVDIFVQFAMPLPARDGTGDLVRDHKKIAYHYLTTWFFIDVLTVLPFDTVALFAPSLFGVSECASGAGTLLKGIKLLRTLRIFKLLRVLRASRIVQRWESSISMQTSTRSLITAWVCFCVLLHWLACLWCLLTQIQYSWREADELKTRVSALIAAGNRTGGGVGPVCTGCVCVGGTSTPECDSPCLTDCELEQVMEMTGDSYDTVYAHQSWMCRAAHEGFLPTDFYERPQTVRRSGALAATLPNPSALLRARRTAHAAA